MKHSQRFEALVSEVRSQIRELSAKQVRDKQEKNESFHLVDVREDHEWQAGHATGARHIGRGILERDIEKHIPDYDAEIVLYCGGGYRSALDAVNLQKMGYKNVFSMDGGMRAWQENSYPVSS